MIISHCFLSPCSGFSDQGLLFKMKKDILACSRCNLTIPHRYWISAAASTASTTAMSREIERVSVNDLTPLLFLEHYAVASRPVVLLEA
eukprot:s1182_g33.t1